MLILQERTPDYFCHKEKLIACHKWDDGDKYWSSFIIKAIPLIARGQLVWVEGKEDVTTSSLKMTPRAICHQICPGHLLWLHVNRLIRSPNTCSSLNGKIFSNLFARFMPDSINGAQELDLSPRRPRHQTLLGGGVFSSCKLWKQLDTT